MPMVGGVKSPRRVLWVRGAVPALLLVACAAILAQAHAGTHQPYSSSRCPLCPHSRSVLWAGGVLCRVCVPLVGGMGGGVRPWVVGASAIPCSHVSRASRRAIAIHAATDVDDVCTDGWMTLDDGVCYHAASVGGKGRWADAVKACGTGSVASVPTARVNQQLSALCAMEECWPGHSMHPSSWAGLIAPYLRCGSTAQCWLGLRSEDPGNGRPFQWAGELLKAGTACSVVNPFLTLPGVATTDNGDVDFTSWKSRVRALCAGVGAARQVADRA